MATAAFAKRALLLLWAAVGSASSCRCDCEAQREEIARLHATIRALRAPQASQAAVPEVAPTRRAAGVPTCDGEHVELETDEDVRALQGCRALQRLTIRGDGVTSLAGLQSLETATEISIVTAGTLTSLAGLENLTKVGSFIISFNRNLVSLEGLQSLQSAGRVEVLGNLELRSLTGLEQLTRVEADLSVGQTTWLHSLAGLEGLQSAGGLKLQSNRGLKSLAGPESLTTVEGSLDVRSNGVLESLAGLANVTRAESLNVEHNGALESLSGLEGLTTVGTLRVFSNDKLRQLDFRSLQLAANVDVSLNAALESLAGLDHIKSVESLKVVSNGALTSLLGLQGLTSAGALEIRENRALLSLSALERLQTVEGLLSTQNNDVLESLSGLESLTSVGALDVIGHDKLLSLSGLEQLQTISGHFHVQANAVLESLLGLGSLASVGALTIGSNSELVSLSGLGNLLDVWGDLTLTSNSKLVSLEGLERLQSVRLLQVSGDHPELRSLFPGLQSLAYAYCGVVIEHCQLSSLHGLATLHQAAGLRVRAGSSEACAGRLAPMQFLGGPFAAGASIGSVYFDEGVWPQCTTPHEHLALVSATKGRSFVPAQRCSSRELIKALTCVRGQPCSFSVANFSVGGEERGILGSIFVSGLGTGCGTCPEDHLQTAVTASGAVEFGADALRHEEVGLRSLCLCGAAGERGPVGQLLLRGPRTSGVTTCSRGHDCLVALDGEALERTDHVVLVRGDCNAGNPNLGFVATWNEGNEYLLNGLTGWYAAPSTSYRVCWQGSCPLGRSACPGYGYLDIGQVELLGPSPNGYTVILGGSLTVANIGLGVLDGDRMRLLRTCGRANEDGLEAFEANSSGRLFHFGVLADDRMRAGRHHLCWCQERDGRNGVECKDEHHFVAESGEVHVLCPAGQELVGASGRCARCPPGRHRLEAGLDPCSECAVGKFSPGGEAGCQACPSGTFAGATGLSACVACRGWESASAEAAGCTPNPTMLALLASFTVFVVAFCALSARNIRRRLFVVDVSVDEKRTIVTTFGPHGLSNFGSASFPVTLRRTGHPGLDSPSEPLRARVKDTARLELLTQQGSSIDGRLDSSMGTLTVAFPYDLYHRGWPVPMFVGAPALLIVAVALGVRLVMADMATEAAAAAAIAALLCAETTVALRARPRATPLARSLSEFKQKLEKQSLTRCCAKGSGRAIAVGRLQQLMEFFQEFIRDRTAYYLVSNILWELTKSRKVSYAELVGPGQVEWFVSHFWGTAYAHFCMALRKHAETVCDNGDWTRVRYWVCFCSNNQHSIEEELGAGWQESSFYLTLKSGHCRGTCMVLDDQALPLTRIWCIFELLQTVNLQRVDDSFHGLLFCTSSGVLNTGSGSVEVAMALAEKVADLDLATAQATSEVDAERIRSEVVRQMGSFAALNRFVCHEVHDMLGYAQANANQQFAAVLARLKESIAGPVTLAPCEHACA